MKTPWLIQRKICSKTWAPRKQIATNSISTCPSRSMRTAQIVRHMAVKKESKYNARRTLKSWSWLRSLPTLSILLSRARLTSRAQRAQMIRCHVHKNMSGKICSMRDEILSIKLSYSANIIWRDHLHTMYLPKTLLYWIKKNSLSPLKHCDIGKRTMALSAWSSFFLHHASRRPRRDRKKNNQLATLFDLARIDSARSGSWSRRIAASIPIECVDWVQA